MLFYEFPFLFLFLPVVLLGYHALQGPRARLGWVFGASCAFYAASSWVFLPLLLLSVGVDYFAAGRIARTDSPRARWRWLLVSLVFNLGSLCAFKYAKFITQLLADSLGPWVPIVDAPLPVGISFYTFQSLSYTVDVYRGKVKPARSLLHFAAYVTLFPQLIAGPIVRYSDLEESLERPSPEAVRSAEGIQLFVRGLAKKLILADTCAHLAQPLFDLADPGFAQAWGSMLLFAGQIYWDFSGYSDMAIGLGRLFGFEFPRNFDSPYQACTFSDFWRRWHISLSTWLRDYLYVPLGGSRRGAGRTYLNLGLTMLLGGLWHGASWNFVLWGAAHGALLALERALGERNPLLRLPAAAQRAFVFLVVVAVWVPFRFEGLAQTSTWLQAMFLGGGGLGSLGALPAAACVACVSLAWFTPNTNGLRLDPSRWGRQAALTAALFVLSLAVGYGRVDVPPFLYFRF